ncbi:recombinase family protein [uncultured Clostridium sp.]|uniref:recombinase family protein n=1 Tax=uncultured Clostridium sp. TaxID=59620 RepID=UPI0025FBE3CF|nr:recombinase family protein [uncultured Clostridium sp.]
MDELLNKNKIAIYCRVSSDDQKERDTIENQIEILNTYIEFKENLEKAGEYLDDGISGTIPFQERPAGKRLIEGCKNGLFNSILVWKIDRFGRDTLSGLSAVELLRQYNVEIISVTEPFDLNTPTGRFQFITYLNMAELERNNILDRMFIGATRAAKKGKWLGGIVPYGYYVNKERYLEINEFEANVVRKIFDLYIHEKMSTLKIAIYLNNIGIDCNYAAIGTGKSNSNKRKAVWSLSSIQRILSSETYKGIHEYGKRGSRRTETIIREVPAIIPIEVYEEAEKARKNNKITASRNSPNRNFLLRRLIKCEECGRTFYGVYYKSKNSVYSCSGKKPPAKQLYGVKCTSLNINADDIEKDVWNLCVEFMKDYKNLKLNTRDDKEIEEIKNNIKLVDKNLKNLENEKNNVIKLFRKEIITESELEIQIKDLKKDENRYIKYRQDLNNNLDIFENKNRILNDYENTLKYYKDRLENLTLEEKQEVLNLLIKEIRVGTEIVEGELIPKYHIFWYMSDLISVPTGIACSYK